MPIGCEITILNNFKQWKVENNNKITIMYFIIKWYCIFKKIALLLNLDFQR